MTNATGSTYYSKEDENYHSLYCLDLTKWMGSMTPNTETTNTVTYTNNYDMEENKENIVNKYLTSENYNAILWLMDNIYVPNDKYYKNNAAEKKADKLALLNAAGIEKDGEVYVYYPNGSDENYRELRDESALLTDEDIIAVQQAVIWRYNPYTNNDSTKKTVVPNINEKNLNLTYTNNGKDYNELPQYKPNESESNTFPARTEQAVLLYNYLTTKADEAAKNGYKSEKNKPITINTDNCVDEFVKKSAGYVLGPISITKNNDLSYDINLGIKNGKGENITEFYFSDSEGNKLENNKQDIRSLVGQEEFYITITDETVDAVNVQNSGKNVMVWRRISTIM